MFKMKWFLNMWEIELGDIVIFSINSDDLESESVYDGVGVVLSMWCVIKDREVVCEVKEYDEEWDRVCFMLVNESDIVDVKKFGVDNR